MNRFDAGRCRLDYRRALQAQLDRHHGNQRPSQRLADAFKFVDGVLESKVPKAVAARSSLIASAAAAGSSSKGKFLVLFQPSPHTVTLCKAQFSTF